MQIYKITNIINNKIYIGKDTKNRTNYYGSGIIINFAIRKYGKENFKKEILQECNSIEELNEAEKHWIKELNSIRPNGYNITKGGDGGDTYSNRSEESKKLTSLKLSIKLKEHKTSDETKRKIGLANKIKNTGHIHSKEHKVKIGLAHKGMKRSKITCENISKSLLGKPLSKEHKEKLKFAHIGLKQSKETILKRKDSMKKINQKEYRKKISESMKIVWKKKLKLQEDK
jgi:hypothetical protein